MSFNIRLRLFLDKSKLKVKLSASDTLQFGLSNRVTHMGLYPS